MSKLEKEKKLSKDDKMDVLLAGNQKIVDGLNTLATVLTKFVENSPVIGKEEVGKSTQSPAHTDPELLDETRPNSYVPPRYRQIVDQVLSPDFGIRVHDFEDRTEFMIDIIVPEQYSSMSKKEKDSGAKDIRSRVIPRAMGENGVKSWCETIRTNLNKYYGASGVQSPFSINRNAEPTV